MPVSSYLRHNRQKIGYLGELMIRDSRHHHLFTKEWQTPQGDRLYFHYSSYDEDGVVNTREFKETALAAYEQAIQLAPHEASLHYHKGQLLAQLGRPIEAIIAFEEADKLGY
jgi:tetratricopeptide (TPR) repeat protein